MTVERVRPVRPKPSAALILVDRNGPQPKLLLGRRHPDQKFMPNKYVFPGGRTDPDDARVTAHGSLSDADFNRLRTALGKAASPQKLLSVALSAIREMHEETGLVIARSLPQGAADGPFAMMNLAPFVSPLRIIARAVTPPLYPYRYDTHFFSAFRDEAVHEEASDLASSDELLDPDWYTLDETKSLDLPEITRIILADLEARLRLDPGLKDDMPIPFYVMRRGQMRREMC